MDLPADPGLALTIYTAAPGSPSEDALYMLASWAISDVPEHPATPPRAQESR